MDKRSYHYFICNGDVNSYKTHGGLPFNFFKAAHKFGLIERAVTLNYRKLLYWKLIWNLIQFLKFGKAGGFQYSDFYARKILKQINISFDESINILSIYPFLPSYPWPKKWNIDFYIDATTLQIFKEYSGINTFANSYKKEIIFREKQNYKNAKRIMCRSNWAIQSLINEYQINKKKIYLVPGGANLNIKSIDRDQLFYIPSNFSKKSPIKLGFIGVDWERKGGEFLIKLLNIFYDKNVPIELRVVGPKKDNLPTHPCLKYVGFIDKSFELERIVKEITSWHFGTLFSKAEAYGISNRECMFLGVPVICHDIGGISSTLPKSNFGKLFEANPDPRVVFEWIIEMLIPYEKYISLRKKLLKKQDIFTWEKSVIDIKRILYQDQ